jgi:hypothetical protein
LGITLYERFGSKWTDSNISEDNTIEVPSDLLQYEKNFLVPVT